MFNPGSEPHGAAVPARLSSPMDALGYVGHGKGPWDATTYDFRENFVIRPLAPPPLAVFFAAPMSAPMSAPIRCSDVRTRSREFVEARTQRLLLDSALLVCIQAKLHDCRSPSHPRIYACFY